MLWARSYPDSNWFKEQQDNNLMYGPEKRQCLDSFAKAFCFGISGGERKEPSDGGCVIRLDGSLISTVDMFECQVLDILDMFTPCKPLSKWSEWRSNCQTIKTRIMWEVFSSVRFSAITVCFRSVTTLTNWPESVTYGVPTKLHVTNLGLSCLRRGNHPKNGSMLVKQCHKL